MHFNALPYSFYIHPYSFAQELYAGCGCSYLLFSLKKSDFYFLFSVFRGLSLCSPFCIHPFYYPRNSLLTLLLQACFSPWVWTVKQHAQKNNIRPYAKPASKVFPVQTPNKRFQNKRDHSTFFSTAALFLSVVMLYRATRELKGNERNSIYFLTFSLLLSFTLSLSSRTFFSYSLILFLVKVTSSTLLHTFVCWKNISARRFAFSIFTFVLQKK